MELVVIMRKNKTEVKIVSSIIGSFIVLSVLADTVCWTHENSQGCDIIFAGHLSNNTPAQAGESLGYEEFYTSRKLVNVGSSGFKSERAKTCRNRFISLVDGDTIIYADGYAIPANSQKYYRPLKGCTFVADPEH